MPESRKRKKDGFPASGRRNGRRFPVDVPVANGLTHARRGDPIDLGDHDDERVHRLSEQVRARGWDLLDHITGPAELDPVGLPRGLPTGRQVWVTHSIIDGSGKTLIGPATVDECEAYVIAKS